MQLSWLRDNETEVMRGTA